VEIHRKPKCHGGKSTAASNNGGDLEIRKGEKERGHAGRIDILSNQARESTTWKTQERRNDIGRTPVLKLEKNRPLKIWQKRGRKGPTSIKLLKLTSDVENIGRAGLPLGRSPQGHLSGNLYEAQVERTSMEIPWYLVSTNSWGIEWRKKKTVFPVEKPKKKQGIIRG